MFVKHSINIVPRIVTPLLDVPGIKARSWKHPIRRALLNVSSSLELTVNVLFLFHISLKPLPQNQYS